VQNHALKPNRPFLSEGVGLLARPTDETGAELYLVNPLFGTTDTAKGSDKTIGTSLWWKRPNAGRAELAVAWEPRAVTTTRDPATQGDDAQSIVGIDLNGDVTAWRDQGWFFAAQAQYHLHPRLQVGDDRYGNDLILLGMANYAVTPTVSATLMVDWVERGFSKDGNEILETAVAILTRPHPQVRFNAEVFYWDERAGRADAWGGAAVLLVAMP
jgi:hypothetical protein